MTLPFLMKEDGELANRVWGFSKKYLVARYGDSRSIPAAHKEWWALCCSEHPKVAIAAPRAHAKSTAVTFAYVLYSLLTKRASHVLLLGANERMASAFLAEIKAELLENEALRADFGVEQMPKQAETEFICELSGGHRFRVIVKGANQRLRGLKWERKRPDLVVCDDLEDDELVLNDFRKEKFSDWFAAAVLPMMSAAGKIRVVGTIVGFDSLLSSFMPNEKARDCVIEPLRTYQRTPGSWVSVKYRAHSADFSELLWPSMFTAKYFRDRRSDYQASGKLEKYTQEYLNEPQDESSAYFRAQDFLPMQDGDYETRKTYYAGADLAIGESERNAYTAMVVGGMDVEKVLHIVDVRRERLDGEQIVNEMFSIQKRWVPEIFRVEAENIQRSIGAFLNRRMDEEQTYIAIDAQPPTKDKDKRAQSIRARMRAGKVRFDKRAEWYPDFEEELLKYPRFAFKDQVDAFAWLGLMLDQMAEPQSTEEIEDEEYQETFKGMESGRCSVTGY